MTFREKLFTILGAAALVGSGYAAAEAQPAGTATEVPVIGKTGREIGKLQLRAGPQGTLLRLAVAPGNLTPGWHGIHFHSVGTCADSTTFEASKAHVNHGGKKHGLLNAEGPDDGDLPNVHAAADGSVNAEAYTMTMLSGANGLRDADGSALVIHANADDHTSQPIGGAGERVACAAIK